MKKPLLQCVFLCIATLAISGVFAPLVLAENVTGENQIICTDLRVTRCTSDSGCMKGPTQPGNIPLFFEMNFRESRVQTTLASGARRETTISTMVRKEDKIFIQGSEEGRLFSAIIDAPSGELTAAIATEGETVSIFSECQPLYESEKK